MTTHADLTLVTAEALEQIPSTNERTELVRGELRTMAPAGEEHGEIAGSVYGALYQFVRQRKLGKVYAAETGFVLSRDPDTVRAPDAAFVSSDRLSHKRRTTFFDGPPDLAVEVVSPSETERDVKEKVQDYLRAGTRLVWIIHPPTRTVTVHHPLSQPLVLTIEDTLDGEDVVPGFTVAVREILEWEL